MSLSSHCSKQVAHTHRRCWDQRHRLEGKRRRGQATVSSRRHLNQRVPGPDSPTSPFPAVPMPCLLSSQIHLFLFPTVTTNTTHRRPTVYAAHLPTQILALVSTRPRQHSSTWSSFQVSESHNGALHWQGSAYTYLFSIYVPSSGIVDEVRRAPRV